MSDDGSLARLVGIDLADPEVISARFNAAADLRLVGDLVRRRREAGMSQEDVAKTWGITLLEVGDFETYYSNPQLLMIRRYAQMLHLKVEHIITEVPS